MMLDLRTLPPNTMLDADICVVGSGIAGLALAREFLNSPFRVLMVESGGASGDEGTNILNEGETVGLPYFSTVYGRTRGFGGTSELWAGQCTPMDSCDFEVRPWVQNSGWPFTRAKLDPFYRRASEVFALPEKAFAADGVSGASVAGFNFDPAKLVPHVSAFSPRRFLGRELRDLMQDSSNISVVLHATATRLVPNPDSTSIDRIEIRSLTGQRAWARARAFVLACGAIENARLLLASNDRESCGVGNRNDLVGRFLQDHVIGSCAVVHSERVASLWRQVDIARVGGVRWAAKFRLAEAVQAATGSLNATASIVFDYEDSEAVERMVRLYRALARRALAELRTADLWYLAKNPMKVMGFGARHMGYAMPSVIRPRSIRLSCITEQAPSPDSRIGLSHEMDRLGIPRAKIDWRVTEAEGRTLRVLAELCEREFARVGIGKLTLEPWLEAADPHWRANVRDILHCAGTTRIGADRKNGVVDPNCRVFDIPNLFIAGSSVFPTSGHANPVLTMVALSIRLADHLKATVR